VSLGRSDPGVRSGFLETPRNPFGGVFLGVLPQTASQSAGPGLRCLASGTPSAAVDVDHLQIVGRGLKDVAIVMDLHELAPVGGRATSGRHRWWLERFAKMREDFPDRPRIR